MTDDSLAAPEWCLGCPDPIYDDRRGEMLALDDGWQCPVCNWYRGYYRGERRP